MCQVTGPSGRQSGQLPILSPTHSFECAETPRSVGECRQRRPSRAACREQRLPGRGGKGPSRHPAGFHSGSDTRSGGPQGGAGLRVQNSALGNGLGEVSRRRQPAATPLLPESPMAATETSFLETGTETVMWLVKGRSRLACSCSVACLTL